MTRTEFIARAIALSADSAELALLDAALGTAIEIRNRPVARNLLILLAAAADLAAAIEDNAREAGCPLPPSVRDLARQELSRIDVALTAAAKSPPILVSSL